MALLDLKKLVGAMGIELKATLKALEFRASDMVGRKPVRFLLQESTGFSVFLSLPFGAFQKLSTLVRQN